MNFFENKDKYQITFWVVAILGLALFVLLSVVIGYNSFETHTACFSHTCINYFFSELMLAPFSIVAAVIPICAISLALHKSSQTQTQIALSKENNNINNLFMHRKEFLDVCDNIEVKHEIKFNTTALYLTLFPDNTIENVTFKYDETGTLQKHFNFFNLSRLGLKDLYNKTGKADYQLTFEDVVLAIKITSYAVEDLRISKLKLKYIAEIDGELFKCKLPRKSLVECWSLYAEVLNELAYFCLITPYLQYDFNLYKFDEFIKFEGGVEIREV